MAMRRFRVDGAPCAARYLSASRPLRRALNFSGPPPASPFKGRNAWEQFHATTIVRASRQPRRTGGDGQVTLGNIVIKGTARKIRRLYHDKILAGFAGATADAFTLQERFEAKLEKHQGNPDARGGRTHPRLAHRPRAAPPGSHADRGRRRAHAGADRQRRRCSSSSTAWRPSARAAPMPSRPRWRCCATPSCHPRPSSSSRWKSPATCASTPTRTTSSKRWANARRAARPQRAPPPAPPSPKDPLSCPHPT